MSATVSLFADGCSGTTPPSLPALSQITGVVTEAPIVGPPTEVYARVARGALSCWFGTSGPLKAGYVYHAEAEPASQGGKAEIVVHERDRTSDNPRGLKAYRVSITPDGDASKVVTENLTLAEPLAKSMETDVRRWGAGAIGCTEAEGGGWSPNRPEVAPDPKKPKGKRDRST